MSAGIGCTRSTGIRQRKVTEVSPSVSGCSVSPGLPGSGSGHGSPSKNKQSTESQTRNLFRPPTVPRRWLPMRPGG